MKVTLNVEGMKCGMCEAKVNKIIRDTFPAAKKVKSNKNKKISTFIIDDNADINLVIDNIKKEGYEVTSSKTE